jgi:hypothetical protein
VTKKDYVRAARLLRDLPESERANVADFFCEFFDASPSFNREKFLKACGFSHALHLRELSLVAAEFKTSFVLEKDGLLSTPLPEHLARTLTTELERLGFTAELADSDSDTRMCVLVTL